MRVALRHCMGDSRGSPAEGGAARPPALRVSGPLTRGSRALRPALIVYSREYCHLCDEMIAGLRALQARFAFDLEVVDIDQDPALETRYGEHVPVLTAGGRELCRHRLDSDRVEAWLRRARSASGNAGPG